MTMKHSPMDRLRHHVTDAIERGEAVAITEQRARHSPGPWEVSRLATPDYAPEFGIFRDDPAGAPCLARTMNENSEANARLIAAAPELLAALQTIANSEPLDTDSFVCDFDTLQSVAWAALAKVQP